MALDNTGKAQYRQQPGMAVLLFLHIFREDPIKTIAQQRQEDHCCVLTYRTPVINIVYAIRCQRIQHTSEHSGHTVTENSAKADIRYDRRSQIDQKDISIVGNTHGETDQPKYCRNYQKCIAVKQ